MDFLRLADGYISHDEIIILANQMFKKYTKLCDILIVDMIIFS